MEEFKEYKKYFNRNFWKAFKNKNSLFGIPTTKKEINKILKEVYLEIESKTYIPSTPRCFIDRDKGHGVTRMIPVFNIRDYIVYYYCIKKLEPVIAYNRVENTFGGWTLGGLLRKGENDELKKKKENFDNYEEVMTDLSGGSVVEYSFNPTGWVKAYGELNAMLYATAQNENYLYVAELDIANFYDSINIDLLESKIREVANEKLEEIVDLLFIFLNYWNMDLKNGMKQTVGLPQDAMADCSRILANFYLQEYDLFISELCTKTKAKYLRYADDQFFFCEEDTKLEYLLFKASKKLSLMGLSINQKKVRFTDTNELIRFRSFEIFSILKNDDDRKDPEKVSLLADKYIELLDGNGLKNIKDNGYPLLNRILFCEGFVSIDFSKKIKIISCLLDESYLKEAQDYGLIEIYELLPDEQKGELIKKLDKLSSKLIHNAFHYQVHSFYQVKGISTKNLDKRIEELKNL